MTSHRRHCRRAYSLVEMMIVMVILTALAAVASRVFVLAMSLNRDALAAERQSSRVAAALRQLRADVWAARSAVLEGDGRLVLTAPRDERILWHWSAQTRQLQRTVPGGNDPVRRFDLHVPPRFVVARGLVRVELASHAAPLLGPMLEDLP